MTWLKSKERNTFLADKMQLHTEEVSEKYGGENLWCVMLYGSQNYGLDTPDSDVDTKTMVIPAFRDVVLGKKMLSTDMMVSDGSLSNVKDYRAMFQNYLKGNVNFVETLYTEHYKVNLTYAKFFYDLRDHAALIANARPRKLMHMAAGMAQQKYVAFSKPFASKAAVLDKYGYDPKQLHHLVRLDKFMSTYLRTCDFKHALTPDAEDMGYLLSLKTEPLPFEEAVRLRNYTMENVNHLVQVSDEELPEDNGFKVASEYLDNLAVELFKFTTDATLLS